MEANKKPNMTPEETRMLITELLDRSIIRNGERELARGAVGDVAKKFKLSARSVYRLWKTAKENRAKKGFYSASPTKKGNSGRPRIYEREALMEALEEIPLHLRGTQRDIARELGVGLATVDRLVSKERVILPHSNSIKPFLTEHNKATRMAYAADNIIEREGTLYFQPAYDEFHVDEKWFFLSREQQRYYLSPREVEAKEFPDRRCKHKRHIIKVMFLTAVARPRFDADGNCVFDGKIGMWPFVEKAAARRSSVNRPAGTIETKCINISKEVYTKYLIEKVLPAVYDKWPRDRSTRQQTVFLQQDNPNTHMSDTYPPWVAACNSHQRFKVALKKQPANTPDTNVLDLGFFRSLQSLQWKQPPATTIDDLIENVHKAWDQYDPKLLNRIWLSHQSVQDEILQCGGDNNFQLPHIGKGKMERVGQLPASLKVSKDAEEAFRLL